MVVRGAHTRRRGESAASRLPLCLMPLVSPVAHRPAAKYWPLDPLFSAHVKLISSQLSALPAAEEAPDGSVVWLCNHPIQHVDLVGVCVSIDPKNAVRGHDVRLSFTLDDSRGSVDCVCWLRDLPAAAQGQLISQCRLGAVLRVLGRLGTYREQRQVTVERCWAETDLNAESLHWARAISLWQQCYSRSFRVLGHALQHEQQQQQQAQQQQRQQGQQGPAPPPQQQQQQPQQPQHSVDIAELVHHVRSVFLERAIRNGGGDISVGDVVSRLPAAAKRTATTVGTALGYAGAHAVREAVAEACRRLEEDESAIYESRDGRGRGSDAVVYRWAGSLSQG